MVAQVKGLYDTYISKTLMEEIKEDLVSMKEFEHEQGKTFASNRKLIKRFEAVDARFDALTEKLDSVVEYKLRAQTVEQHQKSVNSNLGGQIE